VGTASNIDDDIRRALATHHLHSTKVQTKTKMRTLRPLVVLPASTMRPKKLSVKSRSEYSSTHVSESSSDEEEGLLLDSDETREMISI